MWNIRLCVFLFVLKVVGAGEKLKINKSGLCSGNQIGNAKGGLRKWNGVTELACLCSLSSVLFSSKKAKAEA